MASEALQYRRLFRTSLSGSHVAAVCDAPLEVFLLTQVGLKFLLACPSAELETGKATEGKREQPNTKRIVLHLHRDLVIRTAMSDRNRIFITLQKCFV